MAGSAPFLGWGHMRCGPGRCCQLVACRQGPARLGTTDGPRYRCPAGHLGRVLGLRIQSGRCPLGELGQGPSQYLCT